MDQQTYIKERVDDQIKWYGNKSSSAKKKYRNIRLLATILSLLIPFVTGFFTDETFYLKVAVGAAGVMIAICEYLISANKYEDDWIEYRATSEALKREKYLYLTGSGTYTGVSNAFNQFVVEVEKIMAAENSKWTEYIRKKEDEDAGDHDQVSPEDV